MREYTHLQYETAGNKPHPAGKRQTEKWSNHSFLLMSLATVVWKVSMNLAEEPPARLPSKQHLTTRLMENETDGLQEYFRSLKCLEVVPEDSIRAVSW